MEEQTTRFWHTKKTIPWTSQESLLASLPKGHKPNITMCCRKNDLYSDGDFHHILVFSEFGGSYQLKTFPARVQEWVVMESVLGSGRYLQINTDKCLGEVNGNGDWKQELSAKEEPPECVFWQHSRWKAKSKMALSCWSLQVQEEVRRISRLSWGDKLIFGLTIVRWGIWGAFKWRHWAGSWKCCSTQKQSAVTKCQDTW